MRSHVLALLSVVVPALVSGLYIPGSVSVEQSNKRANLPRAVSVKLLDEVCVAS